MTDAIAASGSTSCDVVVLGAGPAGLAAALQLARSGRSVVVLERSERVGGLAASFTIAGQRVDLGSHRLHPTTSPDVLGVLRDLLGDDLQTRPRNGRMRVAGQWVPFPPNALAMARTLPRSVTARLALDAAVTPARGVVDRRASTTFADAVARTLGPTLLREFYGPYAEKIWGEPADRLSAELARVRVSARGPLDLLRKAWRREPTRGAFLYPRLGFGQIVEALAEAAVAAGADLRLGAAVARVAPGSDGASVVVTTDDGASVSARNCVSTLPLPALVMALSAAVDPDAEHAANALRVRGMLLVYLVVGRSQWSPFDAHYLPALDTSIARISEPKNYRISSDDPRDQTVLCAELPSTEGDECWSTPNEDLVARVCADLCRVGLPDATPIDSGVVRLSSVYPTYGAGYEKQLARIHAALRPWEDAGLILTIGRQGTFAHDNSHHAMEQGFAAATAITAHGFDRRVWSMARERFATHVVED